MAEAGEIERSGAVGRVEAIGGHPREQSSGNHRPRDERNACPPQIRPLAQRDQRRAVGREHRRREWVGERQGGRDHGIRNPAPAAAALEREHEEEGREHDPEQPERVRARLPRRLDHTRVDRERETGDEPADPLEQHRAENDEQPGGKRHRDRGRQPQCQLAVADRRGRA